MKTPRNVSELELIKALDNLGYIKTAQKGSHIKVTTSYSAKNWNI